MNAYACELDEMISQFLQRMLGVTVASITMLAMPALADNIYETVPDKAKGMFLAITGSGSALPDPQRGGASAAIVIDGVVLQFDFGRGVLANQLRVGISPTDVDYAFFTHHHFDHIGEFDYYMISTWLAGRRKLVEVYGPTGTKRMVAGAYAMHEFDVKFVQQISRTWPAGAPGHPPIEPPFRPHDMGAGLIVKTDIFQVTAAFTPHLPEKRSMAYRVNSAYGSVVITGDTGYSEEVVALAKGVDVLVHEAQLTDPGMVSGGKFSREQATDDDHEGETLNLAHSTPSDVGRVGAEAKPGKIIITHLAPFLSVPQARTLSEIYNGVAPGPEIWDMFVTAIHAKYHGPVVVAHDGLVIRIGAAP